MTDERPVIQPRTLLTFAAIASVAGAIFVLAWFGGGSLWPGLVSGFAASLLAFMLALSWESDRGRRRLEHRASDLGQQRATEVRRRFEPVRRELQKNVVSIDFLAEAFGLLKLRGNPVDSLLHPQLLDGAWTANAPRLSELVADYALIADLATTYGRIEELRWRLRYRTEHRNSDLDGMTAPLVGELSGEIHDLLERVGAQIANPDVQPLGLAHRGAATLVASVEISTAGETNAESGKDSGAGS